MINPNTPGPFVVVRFVGRDFLFWRGDGWTPKRWKANRYSWSEAKGVARRMNESGDFEYKVAYVELEEAYRAA